MPKIIGGRPANNPDHLAFRATVALVTAGGGKAFCSAALIAKKLVVTAAHCIEGMATNEIEVLFGESDADEAAKRIPLTTTRMFKPEGSKYFPNFDIAWLKLSEAAPESYTPIEIWRDASSLSTGQKIVLVGFGATSTDCHDGIKGCSGVKLFVETKLRDYLNSTYLVQLLRLGVTPGRGSCFGDSGGPAYFEKDGRWYLLGAANGMTSTLTPEAYKDDFSCESGGNIYTYVGAYTEWLEKTAKIKLPLVSETNPSAKKQLIFSSEWQSRGFAEKSQRSFQDWFNDPVPEVDSWYTMARLLEEAALREPPSKRVLVFQDGALAEKVLRQHDWLRLSGFEEESGDATGKIDTQLRDITPLSTLTHLRSLELSDHAIYDTAALGSLQSLQILVLTGNRDAGSGKPVPLDLGFLATLPHLQILDLSRNAGALKNHTWPKTSMPVRHLKLNHNNLTPWAASRLPWKFLPELETLEMSGNQIDELKGLSHTKKLRHLVLRGNQIKDLSPLANLHHLESLDVQENAVEDFSPLLTLPKLKSLKAQGNPAQVKSCPKLAVCTF